jgi:hypothetical protein
LYGIISAESMENSQPDHLSRQAAVASLRARDSRVSESTFCSAMLAHLDATPVTSGADFFGREHFLFWAALGNANKGRAGTTFSALAFPVTGTEPGMFHTYNPIQPVETGLVVAERDAQNFPWPPQGLRGMPQYGPNYRQYKHEEQLGRSPDSNTWLVQTDSFLRFTAGDGRHAELADFGPAMEKIVAKVSHEILKYM